MAPVSGEYVAPVDSLPFEVEDALGEVRRVAGGFFARAKQLNDTEVLSPENYDCPIAIQVTHITDDPLVELVYVQPVGVTRDEDKLVMVAATGELFPIIVTDKPSLKTHNVSLPDRQGHRYPLLPGTEEGMLRGGVAETLEINTMQINFKGGRFKMSAIYFRPSTRINQHENETMLKILKGLEASLETTFGIPSKLADGTPIDGS